MVTRSNHSCRVVLFSASAGRLVRSPANATRVRSAFSAATPRRPSRFGAARSGKMSTGMIVLICIACCLPMVCCLGIGGALVLPAVQAAREAARRALCSNNLKQIGLALHNYSAIYDCFPPAFVPDEDGRPMHSWRVLILPYLGEQALYDQYRFDEPWDSPHNSALAALMPSIYQCPSVSPPSETTTSYVMAVGPDAFSTGPGARQVDEFADGLSWTIAVVEMPDAGINWMEPRDWDTTSSDRPNSQHPYVFNALIADGSVRSMSEDIDPAVLKALTEINDGEQLDPYQLEPHR